MKEQRPERDPAADCHPSSERTRSSVHQPVDKSQRVLRQKRERRRERFNFQTYNEVNDS